MGQVNNEGNTNMVYYYNQVIIVQLITPSDPKYKFIIWIWA
jgi:hypothetical protein